MFTDHPSVLLGTAVVVGRDRELAAIDTLLQDAQSGFALLTLEGDAGIGKTTLWQAALGRATAAGVRVVSTRPTEAEAALSLAGFADLFANAATAMVERLPPPQRDAFAAAMLQTPAPAHGIDERAMFAAALSLLRLMAADGPLVVAVDDAQWLDTATSRALSFAVRRLAAEPIACLVTIRSGSGRAPTFDHDAAIDARRSQTVGPLSVAALHEVVKSRTGRSLPRPVMVQLTKVCGGNPLFALEAAAALGDTPVAGDRLPVPPSLVELVASRVVRLPAATRAALLLASVASRPQLELVDDSAIDAAVQAGVVVRDQDELRFAHPLYASAIQSQAGTRELRSAHRQLAALLASPEERARHAALGATGPSVSLVEELDAAARLAALRGAPSAAAELQELAVALTAPADTVRAETARVAAAEYWFEAGDLARAEALLTGASAHAHDPLVRARALHLLGQLHARRSSFGQAFDAAVDGLAAAGSDAALTAELEMDVAYYAVSGGDLLAALQHAHAAVTAAERAGSPALLGDALAVETVCEFIAGMGFDEGRMHRARELEDPWRPRAWQMRPAMIHGHLLLYEGRAAEAAAVLGELHAEAVARGEESPIPFSCFWLTWANLWRGDFDAARQRVIEARHAAPLLDDPAAGAMALTAAALLHAHGGSVDRARSEGSDATARFQQLGWMIGAVYALWALGLAELSAGNPAGADAALGHLSDQVASLPAGDPVLGVFIPVEVEALIELGEVERAARLLGWFEQRAAAVDRPWALAAGARCRALLASAAGDSDSALARLAEASAHHARTPIPFERARTLLVAGRVHRRRKEKRHASACLSEALSIFDDVGAVTFAAAAHQELARLGGRPPTADALTATEQRVAELAATGLANRQIADQVFLTAKAVEGNLTRVYRKLGIRSRGGLAHALRREGDGAPT